MIGPCREMEGGKNASNEYSLPMFEATIGLRLAVVVGRVQDAVPRLALGACNARMSSLENVLLLDTWEIDVSILGERTYLGVLLMGDNR